MESVALETPLKVTVSPPEIASVRLLFLKKDLEKIPPAT